MKEAGITAASILSETKGIKTGGNLGGRLPVRAMSKQEASFYVINYFSGSLWGRRSISLPIVPDIA